MNDALIFAALKAVKSSGGGGGGGIHYFELDFDGEFKHDGVVQTYQDIVNVMNDQTKFLWLSLNNLVYIPNITIDGPNGAIAFSTTFVRNDGTAEEPNYVPYISRIIINSSEEIGFEEFALAKSEDIQNGYVEITYNYLKTLKDNKLLEPGTWYRITDFVTTCDTTNRAIEDSWLEGSNSHAKSAGHPFDILVVALDNSTLSHDAKAMCHENDTYFASSKLEAWTIKYMFDNDTDHIRWATNNGKGVIYYMKDEHQNECDYDFKNIMFYRNRDLYDFGVVSGESGVQSHTMKDMLCASDGYYYTFTFFNNANDIARDATVEPTCTRNGLLIVGVTNNNLSYLEGTDYMDLSNNVFVASKHCFSSGDNLWCDGNILRYSKGNTLNLNDFDHNTLLYFYNNIVCGRQFQFNASDANTYKNKFYVQNVTHNVFNRFYNNTCNNYIRYSYCNTVYDNVFKGFIQHFKATVFASNTIEGNITAVDAFYFMENTVHGNMQASSFDVQCTNCVFGNMLSVTIKGLCSYVDFYDADNALKNVNVTSIAGSNTAMLPVNKMYSHMVGVIGGKSAPLFTFEGTSNNKTICHWIGENGKVVTYIYNEDTTEWELVESEILTQNELQEIMEVFE